MASSNHMYATSNDPAAPSSLLLVSKCLVMSAVVRVVARFSAVTCSPPGVCPGGLEMQSNLPAKLFFVLPAGGFLRADNPGTPTHDPRLRGGVEIPQVR